MNSATRAAAASATVQAGTCQDPGRSENGAASIAAAGGRMSPVTGTNPVCARWRAVSA